MDYNAKAPQYEDDGDIDGDGVADVYVYAVVNVEGVQMTLKRVRVLEKNQGYIVKGKAGTYTFSYTDSEGSFWDGLPVSGIAQDNDRLSILDGVAEETERDGMYVYTMYYKANYGLGFYNFTGEFLGANKAYLDGKYVKEDGSNISLDGDGDGSGFIILDDNVGGVTSMDKVRQTADDESDKIFTIYGQKVKRSEMIKGRVYIVNGMKVVY